MIHITGNDRYAQDAKNFGKSLRKLREIGPKLLGVSFKEILARCDIPEEVYRVYAYGLRKQKNAPFGRVLPLLSLP